MQASAPSVGVSLSRVGVTNVEKVIRIGPRGAEQLYHAKLDCFVDLGPERKGVDMSRFDEVVNDVIGEVVLGPGGFKAEQMAQRIAVEVRRRQDALRAEVTIAARYPEHKPAPVSGIATQEIYTLFGTAVASERGTRRLVGVAAQGMTASPRAQRLVAERSRERLAADGFSDDQIAAILEAVPIATHDQRGLGTLHLGLPEECDTDVDAIELLAIVEDSMSSEIYELMKRSDEGAVVEKATRRPRAAEDCVHEALRGTLERFGDLGDDAFVSARQENLETIHQHSVVAERYGLFGELRETSRTTRRCASGSAQPDLVGAVDPEVVERGAARVAHAEAVDERRVAPARQTVGQHRRAVRGGLEARGQPHRRHVGEPRAERFGQRWSEAPVTRISRGAGTLAVSASAALAAPSSRASHPSRSADRGAEPPAPRRDRDRLGGRARRR